MRKALGISGLKRNLEAQEKFKQAGSSISKAQLEHMNESLQTFKLYLEEFALKYKKEIIKNPILRSHFHEMCSKIGVDPLASNKGFWTQVLGFGDFYYELGVKIIEICYNERAKTGAFISLTQVQERLCKSKNSSNVSIDDIICSIKNLGALGNEFKIISIGDQKFLQCVPKELDVDHLLLLSLCKKFHGCLTIKTIFDKLNWNKIRIDQVLNSMLNDGILWVDYQSSDVELCTPVKLKTDDHLPKKTLFISSNGSLRFIKL